MSEKVLLNKAITVLKSLFIQLDLEVDFSYELDDFQFDFWKPDMVVKIKFKNTRAAAP